MRVLVTGASGLLGRTAATMLLARGDEVTVLQRRPAAIECGEVLGDVADPDVGTTCRPRAGRRPAPRGQGGRGRAAG